MITLKDSLIKLNTLTISLTFFISFSFNSFSNTSLNNEEEILKKINGKCIVGFKDSGMDANAITLLCNCLIEKYALNFEDSVLLSMASEEEKTNTPDPQIMEKVQKIMNSCIEKIQN